MKRIFVLLFAFIAISCTDDNPVEPTHESIFSYLQGRWKLNYYDGGIDGKRRIPKEISYIQFSPDSTLGYYSKGQLNYQRKYFIVKDASEYRENDSAWFMKISAIRIDSNSYDEYQEIEFRYDSLILIDVNLKQGLTPDGFTANYNKMR